MAEKFDLASKNGEKPIVCVSAFVGYIMNPNKVLSDCFHKIAVSYTGVGAL